MNDSAGPLPYWRLSAFYLFYFAVLGTWLPYWGLYLQEAGYSAFQIGSLAGIAMATKIVAPSLWGWLAAKGDRRMAIIRFGALMAVIAFSGIFFGSGYAWLLCVITVYSFFWNAVLAQFEVVTLAHLGDRHAQYSRIRVWGSIGFIAAVTGLGALFDHFGLHWLPATMTLLLACIFLSSLLIAEPARGVTTDADEQTGLFSLLRQPFVIAFFSICFLLQVSHGPYYTFFSIYLEQYGYSKSTIGLLWSLGVFAEVGLFLVMHQLLLKFSLRVIMLWSLGLTALRWMMIALLPESLPSLLLAQIFHAASFASFHAIAVELVRRHFGRHQGQGMALYSGLSFGAGGAVGALFSGWLWETHPTLTFVLASAVAALAMIIAYVMMRGRIVQEGEVAAPTLAGELP